jgi:hypothetical protein
LSLISAAAGEQVLADLHEFARAGGAVGDGGAGGDGGAPQVALAHAEQLGALLAAMQAARTELAAVAGDRTAQRALLGTDAAAAAEGARRQSPGAEFPGADAPLAGEGDTSPPPRATLSPPRNVPFFPAAGAGRLLLRLVRVTCAMREYIRRQDEALAAKERDLDALQGRSLEARAHFHDRVTWLEEELELHVGEYKARLRSVCFRVGSRLVLRLVGSRQRSPPALSLAYWHCTHVCRCVAA